MNIFLENQKRESESKYCLSVMNTVVACWKGKRVYFLSAVLGTFSAKSTRTNLYLTWIPFWGGMTGLKYLHPKEI